jgi:hypothetical protein
VMATVHLIDVRDQAMHRDIAEAITLLESWAADQTTLRVCVSKPGTSTEAHGRIIAIKEKTVMLDTDSGVMEISLFDPEFNGDRRASTGSSHGAYLICEFRDDDRWPFYAPRHSNAENRWRRGSLGSLATHYALSKTI